MEEHNSNRMRRSRGCSVQVLVAFFLFLAGGASTVLADAPPSPFLKDDALWADEQPAPGVADPLEPINRVFFHFNDRLYFWLLKPVAQGYSYVVPQDIRICLRDFFRNILVPARLANNLLQGNVRGAGTELARFMINSTIGIAGLSDPAKEGYGLLPSEEDLGQTLGVYGFGGGMYICWPVFGSSNIRDTVGLVGDSFLSPFTYLTAADTALGVGAQVGQQINDTSLVLGDYESFKDAAIDPYVALRDAYQQFRVRQIRDDLAGAGSAYPLSATGKGGYTPSSSVTGFTLP